MSQNIQQIFVANPASSMQALDLLYLGRSPYNSADDFAITFANFVASIGTSTPTASTIAKWDASINFSANSFISGYQAIASAGGSSTLTVTSPYITRITGSTTQTIVMPVVSTLVLGQPYLIVNASTGVVTVNSSGGNLIQSMALGTSLYLLCDAITGTTATSWQIVSYNTSDIVFPLPVASGGTGNNTALTNGELWIGNTGNPPSIATLTAGTNISISNAAGGITISATGAGGFSWTTVTGTSLAIVSNNGYITNNAGLVTLTLPASSIVGDELAIIGKGAGGWKIQCGAGQTVVLGSSTTTTAGSLSSTQAKDCVYLVCTVANLEWTVSTGPQSALITVA